MLTTANAFTGDEAPARPDASSPVQPELPEQAAPASGPLCQAAREPGADALANARHEAFCAHVTGWGGSGDAVAAYRAYMAAYGTQNEAAARVNASRLAARDDVRDRCAWMRGRLAASILLDKAAVRAELFRRRMEIVEKTASTKNKNLALEAMRDVERSLGLDRPEVERTTVTEQSGERLAAAAARIGEAVEAVAARIAGRNAVTVTTTRNE